MLENVISEYKIYQINIIKIRIKPWVNRSCYDSTWSGMCGVVLFHAKKLNPFAMLHGLLIPCHTANLLTFKYKLLLIPIYSFTLICQINRNKIWSIMQIAIQLMVQIYASFVAFLLRICSVKRCSSCHNFLIIGYSC